MNDVGDVSSEVGRALRNIGDTSSESEHPLRDIGDTPSQPERPLRDIDIAHIPGEKLLPPPPLMREPLRSRAYAQNKALREKIDSDILALRILWADSRVCPKKFAARFRSSFSLVGSAALRSVDRKSSTNGL
ncbi:unnamed protein product [Heligmosomoides polygyrus]|uniref:Uncharacterized protein n=1 Tax=Heligmosomoides polygyrus TaxID=6339 RepID=A0A183FJ98_HELPZ|nr:unnamed protein product [Heligmosomoides polygyrus]